MFKRQIATVLLMANVIIICHSVVHIKVTKLECVPIGKFLHNFSCQLKPINRFRTEVFMDTHLAIPVKNVSVTVRFFYRDSANVYKPTNLIFSFNGCEFLSKKSSGLYQNMVMKIVKNFTNINHTCPYSGHVFVRNGYLDPAHIPGPLPPKIPLKLLVEFYEGYPSIHMGNMTFYAEGIEEVEKKKPASNFWNP